MPIPADISESRARLRREQRTVAATYRKRLGIPDPVAAPAATPVVDDPEPKSKSKRKSSKQ